MRAGTAESYRKRIYRVLAHIEDSLDAPGSLEELAAVANFSPYHFHRIFRGMVGESVKEHIRRLRLERAARRLLASSDSVLDIALEAGYQTHESFTRAFRAAYGDSPSGFRENRAASRLQLPDTAQPSEPLTVRIERFGPTRLACVRHVGPYDEVGTAWRKLFAWAGPAGLADPSAEMFGLVHDDPEITPPERLRYDAALVVGESVPPGDGMRIECLPSCEYAVATHHGPYELLYLTYARLCGEWLARSGREALTAPAIEVYRNSPWNARPEDLVTDIHIPLAE